MSILAPITQRFNCCNFVGTFEILKCESSIYFQECFTYFGTLNFNANLRMD